MQPKDTRNAVVILVTDGVGRLLFIKRKDNGKYSLVAGHVKENESPEEAAFREIKEECGLKATFLTPVRVEQHEGNVVHFYSTLCHGEPSNDQDPDQEGKAMWVDVRKGIPKNIWNKLAGLEGDQNIVRQIYDLKKSEQVWVEDSGFMDLSKAEQPDEIQTLLKHPNPLERALALKLSTVAPIHLAQAVLDPDPLVWQTALNHPHADHAINVLASNTRDASGRPMFDRHDYLMAHPKFHKDHLALMAGAVKADSAIPIQDQANRLKVLAQKGYNDIQKSENGWAHTLLYQGSTQHPKGISTDASKEETLEHLKPIKDAYEANMNSHNAIEANNAGLHDVGQISPKAVYHIGEHKLMVKPYEEEMVPLAGWAEGSSQALYHAAGLGHLHQHSFVSNHGEGKYKIPSSVIKLDMDAVPVLHAAVGEYQKKNPHIADEARKIAIMDYMTGNDDRHINNLMVRPDGHLLAIDNTFAFGTQPQLKSTPNQRGTMDKLGITTFAGTDHEPYHNLLKTWWPEVSGKVKEAFDKRLELVTHPEHKRQLQSSFNERFSQLNSMAHEPLNKALGGADFLHNQHNRYEYASKPDMTGVHEKLKMATPEPIKEHRKNFELNVNQHKDTIKPYMSYDPNNLRTNMGEEPKSFYKHGTNKYLIKPSIGPTTAMSAWNELASQAMYHAGGIGHLHQKVHATSVHNPKEPNNPSNAVAIHMEPDAIEAHEADQKQDPRLEKMVNDHSHSLQKIGLMDFLTDNHDRHMGNIMVKSDGQPVAIDHGRSFWGDRVYGHGREYVHEDEKGLNKGAHDQWYDAFSKDPKVQLATFDNFRGGHSDATLLGGGPTSETWDWWDKNKENMRSAFQKHVNMLPNQQARDKMNQSFNVRFNHLDNLRQQHAAFADEGPRKPTTDIGEDKTFKDQSRTDLTSQQVAV